MGIQVKGVYPDMRPIDYYAYGDENIPITGGWVSGGGNNEGSLHKNADHLYIRAGTEEYSSRRYKTANAINLRHFDTVKAYINISLSTSASRVYISLLNPVSGSTVRSVEVDSSGNKTLTINTANLNGEYIVQVGVYTGTPASVTVTARCYHVWGETSL